MESTVSVCLHSSHCPSILCPWQKIHAASPYLSTLVSARRLFMMPRAPTPPENPFWRELEPDWRGCPMAISESCFCIIARFTCRRGVGGALMKSNKEEIFAVCVWKAVHATSEALQQTIRQCTGNRHIWSHRCDVFFLLWAEFNDKYWTRETDENQVCALPLTNWSITNQNRELKLSGWNAEREDIVYK